ncbi:MAG: porin family protein [Chitinophagaceae bacterium]
MKAKLLVPLFAALLISSVSMAQFHAGFKVGTNITKVDGQSFRNEFKYGYHLGVFAEIGLGKNWGIQPEVLFNQYSTSLDSNYKHIYQNVFSNDQTKVKLNYLSIPVLLSYKLIPKVLMLQAGPQFGIMIDKNKKLLQNGEKAFTDGDLSMVGGLQLQLSTVRISGRYVIGLNNINDIDNQDRWRNQGFQLSLGLAL